MSGKEMSGYNRRRSKQIKDVLHDFYDVANLDTETALKALLADVRHFCDYNNLSFADLDRVAHASYSKEKHASLLEKRQ